MHKTKILITGGCGYIGSHTVKKLIAMGEQVIVIDNLSTGSRDVLPKQAELVVGDFADPTILDRVFARNQINAVIHFAASISVPESIKYPEKYQLNNSEKSAKLWSYIVNKQVPHIIYSSTAAVYGEVSSESITEDCIPNPINPYGATKLEAECSLINSAKTSNSNYAILRYFNVAGADPAGHLGQNPEHSHHLISNCFRVVSDREGALEIFGTGYSTPDGTCVRDYIHIDDLANAHMAALAYLRGGNSSDLFNLGTGRGYSVMEIIQAVEEVTGQKIVTKLASARSGDSPRVIADSSKFQRISSWKPIHLDIHDAIIDSWAWYSKQS